MIINTKYNEINYAQKIYENGFQSKYYGYELKLLVIYMRDYLHIEFEECRNKIIEFCKQYYPNYTYGLCYKIINKALNYYKNNDAVLIDIKSITIYEDEYDSILKLKLCDSYTMLLFAMLVRKKLSREVYQIKNEEASNSLFMQLNAEMLMDLRKMSGIKTKKDLLSALNVLNQKNIISMGINAVISLNFMIETNAKCPIILIKNYEDTSLYIRRYWGDINIRNCMYCGEPYLSRNHKQMFCKKHFVSKNKSIKSYKKVYCEKCGTELLIESKERKYICDKCNTKQQKTIQN